MAVYQSGTRPIIRTRTLNQLVPRNLLDYEDRVLARQIRHRYKVPRKASWTVEEDDYGRVFRFEWYEVETNA